MFDIIETFLLPTWCNVNNINFKLVSSYTSYSLSQWITTAIATDIFLKEEYSAS